MNENSDNTVNWTYIWELLEIVDATLPSKLPNLKNIHDAAMAQLVEINESLGLGTRTEYLPDTEGEA